MAAKYTDTITNRAGDALPRARVKLYDGDGEVVTTYTNPELTEGPAEERIADDNGLVELYVADGTYTVVQIYGDYSVYLENVELFGLEEISGEAGDVANKAQASAIGVAADADDMGAFGLPAVPDNSTTKQALLALGQAIAWVTPEMFGAAGTVAVPDSYPAIAAALSYLASIGGGELRMPGSFYATSAEIKVPSNVTVIGAGMLITTVKAIDSLHVNQNVFSNAKNNRLSRTDYDTNIHISDMTVDGNWQGRDPTQSQSSANQGACIKYSTVNTSSIRRVRAINGPLHCIDVMASVYLDDGDVTHQPDGPSLNFVIEDCIAENPQRDDGITTHNSGHGVIARCTSLFDEATYTVGATQQGFETDEGSFFVTVSDCFAKGYTKGFQAKGHTTTHPATNIVFERCTAEDCAISFDISHVAGSTNARNVTFRDCVSRNVVTKNGFDAAAMSLRHYANVLVENLTIEGNSPNIAIRISDNNPNLRINGVTFKDGSSLSGDALGLIHVFASVTTLVRIDNITCETPIGCPAIRFSLTATPKRVRGVTATGTNSAIGCVWMQRNSGDDLQDIVQTGYAAAIWLNEAGGTPLNNNVRINRGGRVEMSGSGSPEGSATAPAGTQYTDYTNANLYMITGTGNTGWKLVTRAA